MGRVQYGKGLFDPLQRVYDLSGKNLTTEQAVAVQGILNNRDAVVLFKGSAGTGKSFTLKAIQDCLKQGGKAVQIFAPQRQQVLDLAQAGLEAQTVAHLLVQLKNELPRNSVWIIDEAGQIGGKHMDKLLTLAAELSNRVILSGDTRQHGAVAPSDALIAMERYAKIQTYTLTEIRRQDPSQAKTLQERTQRAHYKQAVQAASKGQTVTALKLLDQLGWVYEAPSEQAIAQLTKDLDRLLQTGKSCLVVTQTNEAVQTLNASVKAHLKATEQLGHEHTVPTFRPKNTTLGERKDSDSYTLGDYLHFHRQYGSISKGSLVKVVDKSLTHLFVEHSEQPGKHLKMSLKYAELFSVCTALTASIAQGERLQIKFNGHSPEGKRINNGELVTFLDLTQEGHLKVKDDYGFEKTIPKETAILNPGYAITSYAAQGKTVDAVLIYDSQSKQAVNQKEGYVSLSRGREAVHIYTPCKLTLQQNIQSSGDRGLGLDIAHLIALDSRKRHRQHTLQKTQDRGFSL